MTPTLAKALVSAQASVKRARLDGFVQHEERTYATCDELVETGKAALAENGLALLPLGLDLVHAQVPNGSIRVDMVRVFMLTHENGDHVVLPFKMPVHFNGNGPDKAVAAASSYQLGYVYRDILGIPRRMWEPEVDQRRDAPVTHRDIKPANTIIMPEPKGFMAGKREAEWRENAQREAGIDGPMPGPEELPSFPPVGATEDGPRCDKHHAEWLNSPAPPLVSKAPGEEATPTKPIVGEAAPNNAGAAPLSAAGDVSREGTEDADQGPAGHVQEAGSVHPGLQRGVEAADPRGQGGHAPLVRSGGAADRREDGGEGRLTQSKARVTPPDSEPLTMGDVAHDSGAKATGNTDATPLAASPGAVLAPGGAGLSPETPSVTLMESIAEEVCASLGAPLTDSERAEFRAALAPRRATEAEMEAALPSFRGNRPALNALNAHEDRCPTCDTCRGVWCVEALAFAAASAPPAGEESAPAGGTGPALRESLAARGLSFTLSIGDSVQYPSGKADVCEAASGRVVLSRVSAGEVWAWLREQEAKENALAARNALGSSDETLARLADEVAADAARMAEATIEDAGKIADILAAWPGDTPGKTVEEVAATQPPKAVEDAQEVAEVTMKLATEARKNRAERWSFCKLRKANGNGGSWDCVECKESIEAGDHYRDGLPSALKGKKRSNKPVGRCHEDCRLVLAKGEDPRDPSEASP